jgi:feruloyl-CoA synthase
MREDGSIILSSRSVLDPYALRLTDVLEHWAAATPAQTLIARRGEANQWIRVSYAEALHRVRRLAAGLSAMPLSTDRPLMILSGNSIEHLLLGMAAMYVGVPYCPVSPAYSGASSDLGKLRLALNLLTPGLVAAFGPGAFDRAAAVVPDGVALLGDIRIPGRTVIRLAELESDDNTRAEQLHGLTGPETVAKLLLTSGSTAQPKAVITTHRMLCSNQSMLRDGFPFVRTEPPILVDWLPWNHTFGGSHNVGLVLFNGGTLYVDEGRPTPEGMETTLRNLREVPPTLYFNVPKGFDLLVRHLRTDASLRDVFYSRLRAHFFAGAALSAPTWDELDAVARLARGRPIPILSGLGSTETGPAMMYTTPATSRPYAIGVPASGNVVKLAPVGAKLELRARGPSITPGYWRNPELTRAAFDEEGYYRMGDAVELINPADPNQGLKFNGRIAEDFKLASGTWVNVCTLRSGLIAALAPLAQDVVVAGLNREFIALIILPDPNGCRLALDLASLPPLKELAHDSRLLSFIRERLAAHARAHATNSMRVERALVLDEAPSIDHGEITDKGSINASAVIERRRRLMDELYRDDPPPHVVRVADPAG